MVRCCFIALVVVVVATSRAVFCEEYVIVDTGYVQPVSAGECKECENGVLNNLKKIKTYIKQILRVVTVPDVAYCTKCDLYGAQNFQVETSCQKNQQFYDHNLKLKFSNLTGVCNCKLDVNPSTSAGIINSFQMPPNTCPSQDIRPVGSVNCDGGGKAQKPARFRLALNFGDLDLNGVIRGDVATRQAYVLSLRATVKREKPFAYRSLEDGVSDEDLRATFDCFMANTQPVLRKLVTPFFPLFVPCMAGKTGGNALSNFVASAALCTN